MVLVRSTKIGSSTGPKAIGKFWKNSNFQKFSTATDQPTDSNFMAFKGPFQPSSLAATVWVSMGGRVTRAQRAVRKDCPRGEKKSGPSKTAPGAVGEALSCACVRNGIAANCEYLNASCCHTITIWCL